MDHKNLEYFMVAKKLNCCQAHWSLYLACFDFTLVHCPSYLMGKPNALLQRLDYEIGTQDNEGIVLLCSEIFAVQALEGIELEGEE